MPPSPVGISPKKGRFIGFPSTGADNAYEESRMHREKSASFRGVR